MRITTRICNTACEAVARTIPSIAMLVLLSFVASIVDTSMIAPENSAMRAISFNRSRPTSAALDMITRDVEITPPAIRLVEIWKFAVITDAGRMRTSSPAKTDTAMATTLSAMIGGFENPSPLISAKNFVADVANPKVPYVAIIDRVNWKYA